MSARVLVVGPTSAVGRAAALQFAANGTKLFLAGRNREETARIAADLAIRSGKDVSHGWYDVLDPNPAAELLDEVMHSLGGLDGAIIAVGDLGDEAMAQHDAGAARHLIEVNFSGLLPLLISVGDYLEQQRSGFLIVVGSVAGDRGRQSNYTYGAAKGALALYVQGLRNRLARAGVRVVTVKPGFVDTRMTFGKPGVFLAATPATVGRAIVRSALRGPEIVYVPWFWRWAMLIIRLIPERLFKRLSL